MHIDEDHLYYGAAVIQIAEHESFTAINDHREQGAPIECVYKVNHDKWVYLKYRTKRSRSYTDEGSRYYEYQFIFNRDSLAQIERLHAQNTPVFLGLICVQDREICCLSHAELLDLVGRRRRSRGIDEDQHVIYVSLREGGAFRCFVARPNTKGRRIGKPLTVARKKFPGRIFGE